MSNVHIHDFAVVFWMFLVFYVLSAVGYGVMFPVGISMVADISPPEKRGIYTALFATVGGIGAGIGSLFGVTLVPIYGWRWAFAVLGFLGFATCGAILLISEPMRGASEKELASLRGYKYTIKRDDIKIILSKKTNILIIMQGFFGCIPWGAISMWLPAMFYTIALQQNISNNAATLGGNLLNLVRWPSATAGGIFFSWLGDKKHKQGLSHWRIKISIIGISLGVPFAVGTFFAAANLNYIFPDTTNVLEMAYILLGQFLTDFSTAILTTFIILSAFIMASGGSQTTPIMLDTNLPEHRGTMSSLLNVGNHAGLAVAPFMASIVRNMFLQSGASGLMAYVYTLSLFSLMWIPCAVIWIKIHRTYPKDSSAMHKILEERARSASP
ncbi:MAG: MFS transporter [Candidatus Korarchaeota archaeon]